MDATTAYFEIGTAISTTNNGKLMTANISFAARQHIPELIASGKLVSATFINPGDAVRLP